MPVFSSKRAPPVRSSKTNRIEGNLYGIYLHGAENAVARDEIVGTTFGRVNEAGNGVSV